MHMAGDIMIPHHFYYVTKIYAYRSPPVQGEPGLLAIGNANNKSCSNNFESIGLIEIPRKSLTVSDFDILVFWPFNRGIV